MAGGTWNTSSPPIRAGAYFNFVAAIQAAVDSGIVGTTAVIGTGDWGPVGEVIGVLSQGEYEEQFSDSANGTLREAVLGGLDGLDIGGAAQVLVYRLAGVSAAAGTVVLA